MNKRKHQKRNSLSVTARSRCKANRLMANESSALQAAPSKTGMTPSREGMVGLCLWPKTIVATNRADVSE